MQAVAQTRKAGLYMRQTIPFSPPDITDLEIDRVCEVLRSGWLTTGPMTKEFERQIAKTCGTEMAVCLNSATAAMELTLRLLEVGQGDEVITTPYTYTATAAVILHVGAKPVLVDLACEGLEMDPQGVQRAITPRTKAILPVDIGGRMCDYNTLLEIAEACRDKFVPKGTLQRALGRIAVIADAAHSFGASRMGVTSGAAADLSCFSFHAVKNLTTGEGGAVTWRPIPGICDQEIYRGFQLLSLHGQDKDALAKVSGGWEYDILTPGYKCNMTDLMAAIGLAQLERYPALQARRKELVEHYEQIFKGTPVETYPHFGEDFSSSAHLFLCWPPVPGVEERNALIEKLSAAGIGCNVHYKPLPLLSAYRRLGYHLEDCPYAWRRYRSELTLPLHTLLTDDQVERVGQTLLALL